MAEPVIGPTTLFPLEFIVAATPISLQAGSASRDRWKTTVREAARQRVRESDELGFLDRRPLAVTIFCFSAAPMIGDIDNIVKPIMDALKSVAYLDDREVERVLVQKFEPNESWFFSRPSARLATALGMAAPVLYVRVDDDLSWRSVFG